MFLPIIGSDDECKKDRNICRYICVSDPSNAFLETWDADREIFSRFAAVNVVYLTNGVPSSNS